MPTAAESRAALQLVTGAAVEKAINLFDQLRGAPEVRRYNMLDGVPALIGYYTDGSAALAADFYQDERDRVLGPGSFQARTVVLDRTVKIRRAVAWSAEPLFQGGEAQAVSRLAEVVQYEVAKPYRDTITGNRKDDPASAGWQRNAAPGGCRFCRFLAARGAIYRESSAHFASHPHCHCTASPVFKGGAMGPEASVEQYMASRRKRTAKQQDALRGWLDHFEETGKASNLT